MADIVSPDIRSRMMTGIKGKNTRPEIAVRKEMFRRGFRYRLHAKELPGKPDIVFPRFRAVVFVHGCFWHGHDCHLFRLPSTRPEFWKTKIDRNRQNDAKSIEALLSSGWRVAVIWECSTRGKKESGLLSVADELQSWLKGVGKTLDIRG
ncbi:very short patch repair endonuclease [Azonexus hydrophilus]|uniref:Very short patch repair endonuclease n=1 Tax=Azonexus hydrophilus TaxID=418702 RepID=A0A1R1IDE7_9RHOO|nr:very short patch repair endonuclease [Azonexus hydrophilus]OMG56599.1 very short patch repair endonuclease [Azonexus hydrophilus]